MRDGEPTRVVIDVYSEAGKKQCVASVNLNYWNKGRAKKGDDDEDGEDRAIEIPAHHYVPVFDLRRHLRLRTHVENLDEYRYDTTISEKLVLPEHLKSIVQMLVEHKDVGFKDIVMGKSGGAVVLLAGPPGVGKTLTAEVFAENEQRPLYSVQCSQLGTTASDLEDELLKVFSRAKRWNAVLLLDEADVYVHERGTDMEQNAIVSVFLRVLEYQMSVMFLTTNRPDDVDDAVASRCLARLIYKHPTAGEQWRIWKTLAANMGIIVDESIRQEFCNEQGQMVKLSGRDVKNLLKLAILTSKGKPKITADMVKFATQFHPTLES
jgi:SpoVK/Ycf46/Vps4 family AAA+-type ATPase